MLESIDEKSFRARQGRNGGQLLEEIHRRSPSTTKILLTGQADLEAALLDHARSPARRRPLVLQPAGVGGVRASRGHAAVGGAGADRDHARRHAVVGGLGRQAAVAREQGVERQYQQLLREKMESFAGTLKDKELVIFRERLLNEEPLTLREIGEKYDISRERVRQIEERVKRKLKTFLSKEFKDLRSTTAGTG